MIEKGVMTELT